MIPAGGMGLSAALLLAHLLAISISTAGACYITDVGNKTCSAANCARLTGSYQTKDGFTNGLAPAPYNGGINYEFFKTLAPTGFSERTFKYLAQVSAADVAKCCTKCATTLNCQFFRYFPKGTTDIHQGTTNNGLQYAFTYGTPYPPCNLAAGCTSGGSTYNPSPSNGDLSCILFSLTSSMGRRANGLSCTDQTAAQCYPGARDAALTTNRDDWNVGPQYASSSDIVTAAGVNKGTILIGGLNKPRSYWGGSCNPKTSGLPEGKDDPHFLGGDGVRYDFNGRIGKSFCLVTDTALHINMKLGGWLDERTFGAKLLEDGKAIRTWMTALSVMWRDAQGAAHTLYLEGRKGKEMKRGTGFINAASLDGEPLEVPHVVGSLVGLGHQAKISLVEERTQGPYDVDEYNLKIEGLLDATLTMRAAHPLLQTPDEAFVHFNVRLNKYSLTSSVHGVLGQTLREDGSRFMKSLEYKVLTSLLGGPLQADGETGLGYLEGKTEDYVSSDVSAPDCAFSQFSK